MILSQFDWCGEERGGSHTDTLSYAQGQAASQAGVSKFIGCATSVGLLLPHEADNAHQRSGCPRCDGIRPVCAVARRVSTRPQLLRPQRRLSRQPAAAVGTRSRSSTNASARSCAGRCQHAGSALGGSCASSPRLPLAPRLSADRLAPAKCRHPQGLACAG